MPDAPSPPVDETASAPRRPAWIPTVAAIATIALCVSAGNWQHRRMLEKEALHAEVEAAASTPPVFLPAGLADWRAWRFRPVVITGRFDARHQILIDNKVHAGRVGYAVVVPFTLDDGRTVLVDRGFIPGGPSRSIVPSPRVPQGSVTVQGRIALPATGYLELGDRALARGPVWQHVDPARFSEATGIAVMPIVIEALQMPDNEELVRASSLPDTGTEKHLGYMVQWYTFAVMAAALWLWFTVWPRLSRRQRP